MRKESIILIFIILVSLAIRGQYEMQHHSNLRATTATATATTTKSFRQHLQQQQNVMNWRGWENKLRKENISNNNEANEITHSFNFYFDNEWPLTSTKRNEKIIYCNIFIGLFLRFSPYFKDTSKQLKFSEQRVFFFFLIKLQLPRLFSPPFSATRETSLRVSKNI